MGVVGVGILSVYSNSCTAEDYYKKKARKGPKMGYKNPNKQRDETVKGERRMDIDDQARIDAILDKIKEAGYDSLTKEEKEFLFKASKK